MKIIFELKMCALEKKNWFVMMCHLVENITMLITLNDYRKRSISFVNNVEIFQNENRTMVETEFSAFFLRCVFISILIIFI